MEWDEHAACLWSPGRARCPVTWSRSSTFWRRVVFCTIWRLWRWSQRFCSKKKMVTSLSWIKQRTIPALKTGFYLLAIFRFMCLTRSQLASFHIIARKLIPSLLAIMWLTMSGWACYALPGEEMFLTSIWRYTLLRLTIWRWISFHFLPPAHSFPLSDSEKELNSGSESCAIQLHFLQRYKLSEKRNEKGSQSYSLLQTFHGSETFRALQAQGMLLWAIAQILSYLQKASQPGKEFNFYDLTNLCLLRKTALSFGLLGGWLKWMQLHLNMFQTAGWEVPPIKLIFPQSCHSGWEEIQFLSLASSVQEPPVNSVTDVSKLSRAPAFQAKSKSL